MKEKTKKRKASKDEVYKVYLRCDQGERYIDKSRPGQRIRDTGTQLIGYLFSITGNLQEDDSWLLEVRNSEHNHPHSTYASDHLVHQQLTSTMRQSVATMTASGTQPREILSSL